MDAMLRQDADYIINQSIAAVMPDQAVKAALAGKTFPGRVILVAAGKAAWRMAKAAYDCVSVDKGIVITKYDHAKGQIGNLIIREGAHPTPDENGFSATREALEMVKGLTEADTVLFLLSGGGSALFELPLISGEELQDITKQLLACGAEIGEINCIRKRLSAVKGGKFALACMPAKVYSIVLSDVLGDRLDVIASGPAYPDSSACKDAISIAKRYGLRLSGRARELLRTETPKMLTNVQTFVNGSVRILCRAAADACRELGYEPILLTDQLTCEARQAGAMLAEKLRENRNSEKSLAFIAGGETVVKLMGPGKGGRNQELALSAALGISGIHGAAVFSVGSDGTDGPTDAAGGYVDYTSASYLGDELYSALQENDSYHALEKIGGLIITGPTGTNVNDVAVALLKR